MMMMMLMMMETMMSAHRRHHHPHIAAAARNATRDGRARNLQLGGRNDNNGGHKVPQEAKLYVYSTYAYIPATTVAKTKITKHIHTQTQKTVKKKHTKRTALLAADAIDTHSQAKPSRLALCLKQQETHAWAAKNVCTTLACKEL